MKNGLPVALVVLAISFALPTFAQQKDPAAPLESEQAKQIVALVEKASALTYDITNRGHRKTCPDVRRRASEFVSACWFLRGQ